MKYKNKGYCDCCSELTWVRSDKLQGIVCKNCDEPTLGFKQKNHRVSRDHDYDDYNSFELYPRHRKAV